MYQFHITPILPTNASQRTALLYDDIKNVLRVDTVPLVFQYIANYHNYFVYVWERMRTNLLSDDFYVSCKEIRKFSEEAIGYMETPSPQLMEFVTTIQKAEVSPIRQTVDRLDATNLRLMLLMIGVRESIKGIVQTRTVLPGVSGTEQAIDSLFQPKHKSQEISSGITKATKMLAPLFGNNMLMVSQYPDFFGHIADEMERLENTEAYLLTRVSLEHLGFAYIDQFVQPLNCSYREFMKLTEGTAYVDEILYLLKDTFPSRFPHLVLTTAVMKKSLQQQNSSLTV